MLITTFNATTLRYLLLLKSIKIYSFTINTSASDFEFIDSNLSTSTSNVAPNANPCPTYLLINTTTNTKLDKYKDDNKNQPSYSF